jgi:hypothetical protein
MQYAVRCVVGIELKGEPQTAPAGASANLRRHVDDTMRELEHRWPWGLQVEVDPARSEAAFAVVVDAGDPQRAMSKAWGVLSMALHAAGGATSHRPFPRDAAWSVRLVSTKASPGVQRDKTAALA